MYGSPQVWALSKTLTVKASLVLAFLFAPSVYAADLGSIDSVTHGGKTIAQGETVYRSDLGSVSNNWTFNFSWPNSVGNTTAMLAVIRGTFGSIAGGTPQSGVNFDANFQAWPSGTNSVTKSIGMPPLGGLTAQSDTYTVLVAQTNGTFNQSGTMQWFASGGTLGQEPVNYKLLTFTYNAIDVATELPGALSLVQYGPRSISAGETVHQEDVVPNAGNPSQYWRLSFIWPNAVPNQQALVAVFKGTYGVLDGGVPTLGVNYATNLQAWAAGANTVGKSMALTGLESDGAPGTYTVLVAERDPKFSSNSTDQEVQWFASGGTQGVAPRKYTTLTFILTNPPKCCSSVLFLPGIMGSRLYDGAEKLWEPDNENDIIGLELTTAGDSMNPSIEATDVIRTFDAIANVDIYDEFMSDLQAASTSRKIDSYAAVPYDWRLSIPAIIADGSIEATVRSLATHSHSGKATIVAHSNGGLVAKALINTLGAEASSLIDQLVLVGVPQSGTPQAVAALLHGADASIPWSFSEARARAFAKNASFAYHLLPHLDYYESSGTNIDTPVVSFAPGVSSQFTTLYGATIDTSTELRNFINAAEGRSEPGYSELEYPSIGNTNLLNSADSYMSSIGPDWQAPAGVTIHQIAGVGEDTLASITYKPSVRCAEWYVSQTSTPTCTRYENAIIFSPNEVLGGDGTVIEPSALAMSTSSESVSRWWVSLDTFNAVERPYSNIPGLSFLRLNHKSMLEISSVRSLILNHILSKEDLGDLSYTSRHKPAVASDGRLKFTLHSPLALSAKVPNIGVVSEQEMTIPGATYKRYGEVQVIWVPKDLAPTLHLEGVAEGSFILEVDEYRGSEKVNEVQFTGIPSTIGTIVTMEFPDGTIENAEELKLDYNGDAATDVVLAPVSGEAVTLPKLSLTITAENKSIVLGEAIPSLTYIVSGLPDEMSLDDTDITGSPECTTATTSANLAGTYPITCTVGTLQSDYYSFDTFVGGTLTISYKFKGFLKPINDPAVNPSVFKAGSTVPVKFELLNANGKSVQAANAPEWLEPVQKEPLTAKRNERKRNKKPTIGGLYEWRPRQQHYQYNWNTKGYEPGYWYEVSAKLDDGTIKTIMIGLK